MVKKRFIKTKANYTFKKKHLTLDDGYIFERDYMTTSKNGKSNFKFVRNDSPYLQRKHNISSIESDSGENISNEDNSVILNPDYESLRDFAYYGSALELVRSSIDDIIMRYPASVIVSSNKIAEGEFEVYNDFNIDLFSNLDDIPGIFEKEDNNRNFSNNKEKYELVIINGDEEKKDIVEDIISVDIEEKLNGKEFNNKCENIKAEFTCKINGKITFTKKFNSNYNDWVISATVPGSIIRPKKEIYDNVMKSFNGLQKILLNDKTFPKFKATFDTPIITDSGFNVVKRDYIWPSKSGIMPTIEGMGFKNYVSDLIKLAEYYDEYESDNAWRMLTHESIKNLDWSFIRKDKNNDEENINIDTTRISSIIRLWGRQYDEIKQYIDGIRAVNNISYNGKNNIPSALLSKSLENSGWEAKNISPTFDDSKVTRNIFPTESYGKNHIEINNLFLKILKLNSRSILSKKGTRAGLEELLAIFGFSQGEYEINEYVYVAMPKNEDNTYPKFDDVKECNKFRDGFDFKNEDDLDGLPLKRVVFKNGEETLDYVIPWFDQNKKYKNNIYFQSKGGWGKEMEKVLKNPITGKERSIKEDDITDGNTFFMYDETYPQMRVINNLKEFNASIKNNTYAGQIVYINDISDIYEIYNKLKFEDFFWAENEVFKTNIALDDSFLGKYFLKKDSTEYFVCERAKDDSPQNELDETGKYHFIKENEYIDSRELQLVGTKFYSFNEIDKKWVQTDDNFTHYFILENKSSDHIIGYNKIEKEYGWRNILISEFNDGQESSGALRVMYIESLKDDNNGNNPHNGFSQYDGGSKYISSFENIFKDEDFSILMSSKNEGAIQLMNSIKEKDIGFNIKFLKDENGKKAYNFRDTFLRGYTFESGSIFDSNGDYCNDANNYNDFFNPEETLSNVLKHDEAAANSIINSKLLEIVFNDNEYTDENEQKEFKKYVNNVVLFYLKQIIPATAILSIKFSSIQVQSRANFICQTTYIGGII